MAFIRCSKDLALFARDQRKTRGLSQSAAAELVGLQQKTISAFENHPGSTQLDTLFKILSALHLDLYISPKNQPKSMRTTPWTEEW